MEDFDPGDEEYWDMEDFEGYSKCDENNSKLSRIWRKGVNLGKKMVVTGVVVSSAPFVLPPLVALSAIGFAFSVPAGFVFVTYACGEKLLNILLPMPSSTPFEPMYSDEEEYGVYGDDVHRGYEEDADTEGALNEFEEDTRNGIDIEDIEVDSKEYEEDTKHGTEMRIEFADENDKEIDDHDRTPIGKDGLDEGSLKVSEVVEEGGYEEDVGEYMDDEEQHLESKAIPEILEGIQEAEREISLMENEEGRMPRDSLRAVVVAAHVDGENENNVEQVTEDMAFVPPSDIKEDDKHRGNFAGIEEDELRRETTGLIEEMREEGKTDQKSEDSPAKETPQENRGVPVKDLSQDKENFNLTAIPEEVGPATNDGGVIDGLKSDADLSHTSIRGDESGLMREEPKSVVEDQVVVNVKIDGDHTVTDVHQGTSSDKLGTLLFSNEDATGTAGESGFDVSDKGTVAPERISDSLDQMPEGENQSLSKAVEVTVEYHEVVIESVMPVSEHADIALGIGTTAGPEKVKLEEEKIWEQINAMRTIVGYTTTPQPSYAEELKALYVFTGVEPPASSKNPADLADINEKLHFLMSIVGVK
ncbi:uncharacterized protein LOC104890795 [Beta vulgaris subsp. vulgaris]|uniref:uncharacterized protein LOC104890795 n=1 Tax=Beta vulgaris subsp. vulgaris TaxID=3555 RepID=UPI002036A783|nr:uncharacterized protein LOC104890795 [Beta vulgaris subsp. vulgaris]